MTPGTYTFVVNVSNQFGSTITTAPTSSVTIIGKPSAPSKPSVTSGGSGKAEVSWTAPSDGGSAITGYTVQASPGTATCTTASLTHCTVSGLTNGTAYTFTVSATNAAGTSDNSPASDSFTPAAGPPAPPTASATIAGTDKVAISWTAPSSGTITGYIVTANPGGATCRTTTALTCEISGLTASTAYTFDVQSKDAFGSSEPTTVEVLPAAPGNVTLTAGGFIQDNTGKSLSLVNVSFTGVTNPYGSNVANYTITLNPGGLTCTVDASAPLSCAFKGTGSTGSYSGLVPGTTYTASVVANTSLGTSAASTGSITLSDTPTKPVVSSALAYSTNYFMALTGNVTINIGCGQYWGTSQGTFNVALSGTASYPAPATYSSSQAISSYGCNGQTSIPVTFNNLPGWGTYTLSVSATNDSNKVSTTISTFTTDGVLGMPKLASTYNASTQTLNLVFTAPAYNGQSQFSASDATHSNCTTAAAGTLSCSFSGVTLAGGTGVVLSDTISLAFSNTDTNGFNSTFSYPVTIVRVACPAGTCLVGSYYNMNRYNLAGVDLSGIDLTGATLTNVNLSGAKVTNTTFKSTLIQNANFSNAVATGGQNDFTGAALSSVNFSGATMYPTWTSASTHGLSGFDFAAMHSTGTIQNGVLISSNMMISGADLSNWAPSCGGLTTFENIKFVNSNFTGAQLQNCDFNSSYFSGDNFNNANFSGATFISTSSLNNLGTPAAMPTNYTVRGGFIFGPRVVIQAKSLSGADLSNLNLQGASFINTDLSNADFTNSNLQNATINSMSSNGQTIRNPGLITGANFTGANIAGLTGFLPSSSYIGTPTIIAVSGGAPAKMSANVKYDVRGWLVFN
jgi:uncharacterized protein YjbI with pentapeptide repeats